jgi:hypothetical protein
MKKTLFLDQYPIHSLTLMKEDVRHKTMAQMIDYFKEKIDAHPVAQFIAIFDHYAHTKSLNGEIMEGLTDVQNVVFCFGNAIPSTKIVAVRPRSIGICEFEDRFVIEFMEAPKEEIHAIMQLWTKALVE